MQRWFVSSLSEIVIQWFWRKSDKRMKCFIHHLNMWYYMYIQFLQLHICHLRSYYKIKQRYTYIEFSRTFQILHHNMFKTLAYSSNITQNGSCIRTLPSLTLKTLPHHPPHPPFSIYELSVFSPKLFWNFWKKHYTLNPLHQISSAPDKSHPQSYEIPPYADHSFFHYMRISITHAHQVYVVIPMSSFLLTPI